MKKVMVLLCGLLLVSGVYAAGNQMTFGINFGIMTDDSFSFDPFFWTAGAELDLPFGNYLMFSPEVTLVGNGFKFKEFLLFPAAILNFTPGNFFVGGGLTKGFYIGSGDGLRHHRCRPEAERRSYLREPQAHRLPDHPFQRRFDGMLVGASSASASRQDGTR